MLLWVLFAALAAAAAMAIARPFLFTRTQSSGGMASAIYRAQLAELRQETESGEIAAADAEEARREIARRLLAADAAEKTAVGPGLKRETVIGLGLTLIVPVAALVLYVSLGRPDLPGQPLASRDMDAAMRNAPLDEVAESLFQRLAMDPGHAEGWLLLARTYMRLERYDEAASAYGRAIDLLAEKADAGLFSAYGEALTLAAGGRVTDAATQAFTAAQRLDPKDPPSRFYLALKKAQGGDVPAALADLNALLAETPESAPQRPVIEAKIAELQRSGDIAENPQVQAMVEGLAAKLEADPKNLDGWLLLMTSYVKLGREDDARAALAKARATFADDAAALEQIAAKAKELGLES